MRDKEESRRIAMRIAVNMHVGIVEKSTPTPPSQKKKNKIKKGMWKKGSVIDLQ